MLLALGELQTHQGELVALRDGRPENTSAHVCGRCPEVSRIRQKGKQQQALLPSISQQGDQASQPLKGRAPRRATCVGHAQGILVICRWCAHHRPASDFIPAFISRGQRAAVTEWTKQGTRNLSSRPILSSHQLCDLRLVSCPLWTPLSSLVKAKL